VQQSVFKPFGLVSHLIMKLKRVASPFFKEVICRSPLSKRKAVWEVILENKEVYHSAAATLMPVCRS